MPRYKAVSTLTRLHLVEGKQWEFLGGRFLEALPSVSHCVWNRAGQAHVGDMQGPRSIVSKCSY